MSESIITPSSSTGKKGLYESMLPQIKALIDNEPDFTANLSNIMAALKFGSGFPSVGSLPPSGGAGGGLGFFWVGCYFVKGNELVLGPFQGPVACTRIAFGKGVCGTCWEKKNVIIVEDVNAFPGHIACSPESKSEIVLPVFDNNGEVALILDVDSDKPAHFDDTDKYYLQQVVALIENLSNG